MSRHSDGIQTHLARSPLSVRQLIKYMGISQPTISRAIAALGDELVRIGRGPSIQYALRDAGRGIGDIPVYRISAEGQIRQLGTLLPVRPDGFVMQQIDGNCLHSDALPWWLFDMRPQGYLGRAYAARHAAMLGLPGNPKEWSDTHVLRSLLAHGHDAIGNLLLGNAARDHFLSASAARPLGAEEKPARYIQLAEEAGRGELPGSSAGGEQPKFVTCAETPQGPRHLIVKFTVAGNNPLTERWRDLLLAEHLALETLAAAGIPAVQTWLVDIGQQRFLEVERFDRVGPLGRRGLFSLAALDAEFVGAASGWAGITQALVRSGHIEPEAAQGAALLQAIGTLIGNTDMHAGNLSFIAEQGRPYSLAPAYDMLPMGFAPGSSGTIPSNLPAATIYADIAPETWRRAEQVARTYLDRLRHEPAFSPSFQPCLATLADHLKGAAEKIARLG